MKSIQSKIIAVMTLMTLVSIVCLFATNISRVREYFNNTSDTLILLSAEKAASEIDAILAGSEGENSDLSEVKDVVSGIILFGESNAFLVTEDGKLFYHGRYGKDFLAENIPQEEKELASRLMTHERDQVIKRQKLEDGKLGKVVLEDLGNGLTLIVCVHRRNIGFPKSMYGKLLITYALVVTFIYFGSLFLVRTIIRPLKKMTVTAEKYANGDYSEKMEVDRKDEVGQLSRSLETMSKSLRQQIEIADHANKAKSAFLSNMSHEIRTPITAVLGFNEMILRESKDEQILSYAENIENSGHTLLGLINDVLDFSKIEAGKIEIIPVDYDMTSVINDLVSMIKVRAEEKGLALTLDFDRNIPRILNGDEVRIKQIIMNILTNAVKYTDKGGVTFTIGFDRIDSEPDSIELTVSVEDTGIGIREEDIKRLFTQFERVDEMRNRNIEGTGLGLNITQSLLEMMGSTLKVESIYGVGSVFSFALKQKVVKWDPLGDYRASNDQATSEKDHYKSRFTAKSARVLIVDDNPTNLLVFKSLIKQTMVRIDTAESGDGCLRLCETEKYDIIFLDHMMPRKDGIETLHELKEQPGSPNADTPVICLTANAVSGARENYISEGFKDYLAKPIDPEKLEEMMLEYLPADKIDGKSLSFVAEKISGDEFDDYVEPQGFNALYDQELIDIKNGVMHCGSKDTYLEILKSYYDSIDESVEELKNLLKEGNLEEYSIKAHSIKSISRTLGVETVGEKAFQLEKAGEEGNAEYVFNNHDDFLNELEKVRKILRKVYG